MSGLDDDLARFRATFAIFGYRPNPSPPRSMLEIRTIARTDPLYAQEVALRESALLGPIGLDLAKFTALFPGAEERFEHFVAVFDHPDGPRVVGCALLLPDYPEPGIGKLMQMAVDPQRQGEGIGTRLVVAIERRAFAEIGLGELYCHARDTAYGFYSSLGWEFCSEVFEEAGVPHRKMAFKAPSQASEATGHSRAGRGLNDPLIGEDEEYA